jgi:hypothetical protein
MGRLNLGSGFEVTAPTALLALVSAAFISKKQHTYNNDKKSYDEDDGHVGYPCYLGGMEPRTAHTTSTKIPIEIKTSASATSERKDPDVAIFLDNSEGRSRLPRSTTNR